MIPIFFILVSFLTGITSTKCSNLLQHARVRNFQAITSDEAFARRTYFYVGGRYVNATLDGIVNGTIFTEQMYVESLEPLHTTQKWPIVIIEGAGQTATNYMNTPDGRPGWATYFLNQGYQVYLVDQVARGRSPWVPLGFAQNISIATVQTAESYWTAPQLFNLWPQAKNYSQWPGTTGLQGDPVFDAFYASQVQLITNFSYTGLVMQAAGLDLLEKIGPAILLTHSQSGQHGWLIADAAQPQGLVKGIIAIEPEGPPFVDLIPYFGSDRPRPYGLTSPPLTYSPPVTSGSQLQTVIVQPPAGSNGMLFNCTQQDPVQPGGPRQLINLQGFPVLVVTGAASFHATYEYCTIQYLKDAGVDTAWLNLGQEGIEGNGHFSFLEKNNQVIVERINDWIISNVQ